MPHSNNRFPRPIARDEQLDLLETFITDDPETTPSHIVIRGPPSTGKTHTLIHHLSLLHPVKYTYISCDQCLSVKVLWNRLIDGIKKDSGIEDDPAYDVAASSSFQGFIKAIREFVDEWDYDDLHYLVLDRVDQVIEDHEVVYDNFSKFQEVLGCGNFKLIFVKNELALRFVNLPKIEIFFDRYDRDEMVQILQCKLDLCTFPSELKITPNSKTLFWSNYTQLIIDLYFPYTTNLSSMTQIIKKIWPDFITPIVNGTIPINEFLQIYRYNLPLLTSDHALQPSHQRYNATTGTLERSTTLLTEKDPSSSCQEDTPLSNLSKTSKFLVISAYIASHTPAKADYLLFSKLQPFNKRNPVKLKSSYDHHDHSLHEPSLFTLERWLAITHAIYDIHCKDKLISDVELYTQIGDLETLKFVVRSDKGSTGLSGFGKWRVNLSEGVVKGLGAVVGVKVDDYLV